MSCSIKIKCAECGREIAKCNYIQHLKAHENGNFNKSKTGYHVDHDDLFCKFCGKECKNKNSLAQHEIRCSKNPQKINTIHENFNSFGRKSWNKGLTKDTDERLLQSALKASATKRGRPGQPHTAEAKQKLREAALRNGLGGFHMRRGILYRGIKLDSSYEVEVAKSLDENGIVWERPGRFQYYCGGKKRFYTPDFYLPDYDVYLDPKNDFLIENVNPNLGFKDIDKIKQVERENNIKVLVLNKTQLQWEQIQNLLENNADIVE